MNVAIIPARGGSKRIPRKNIREFCGKPMIAWSIEAARGSGCFERIVVSTEDAEIAALARELGAETPFVRPEALADDHATTLDVMQHASRMLVRPGDADGAICCIYPAAPFLEPGDLREGLEKLRASGAPYAISVVRFEAPIQRALGKRPDGRFMMTHPEFQFTRTQDLPHAYRDAGQFYWGWNQSWLTGREILGSAVAGVELPLERARDIDWPEDWTFCEILFKARSRAT